MKNNIKYLVVAFALLTMVSCKKTETTPATATDYTSQFETQTDDVTRFNEETDAVDADANTAIEGNATLNGGRIEGGALICDGTVSYSDTANKVITINYNGTTCDGLRKRFGTVTITLNGGNWNTAGSSITITCNLVITRLLDNKPIRINGTKTITNMSGGILKNLAGADSIVHTITTASNGISVTFEDSTVRTWYLSKRRVYTYNSGDVLTLKGTHNDGTYNNVAVWGINRFGNAFSTAYTVPIVINQSCNYRVGSGEITHRGLAYTVTVTYGLNSSGVPTGCPGTGAYYYEIAWTVGSQTNTKILPY